MAIGKIERLPLREVWKHEALDFTVWLRDNLEELNEVTGLSLTSAEREFPAGRFSVDLVAENESGGSVVIENQLERSDHDHLGKLLTYLVAIEAKAALWLVSEPRSEHVNVISWLNETSAADFYLIKVEAISISGSPPAPLLTLIVGPSEESREAGQTKKELAEREVLRFRFWSQLLDRAKAKTHLQAKISPSRTSWVGSSAGVSGLSLNYVIRQNDGGVELYIDRGKDKWEENEQIFDHLIAHRDAIEDQFRSPLEWQRLEGRQACRVASLVRVGGYRDEESKWSQIQDEMIDRMIRLEKALRPHIEELGL